MEHIPATQAVQPHDRAEGGTSAPLVIVTMLFFMWGLLTSLNDVLIPHLKAVYTLSYVQAMLVQFCFFGAYFIVSLPAGMLIRRIGYQRGVVVGLTGAAIGCALFYPAAMNGYGLFLLAFFVLAAGITTLQVAANPYVTVLGDARTASSRLTLTQAFNSLGTTIGPALGGLLILSGTMLDDGQLAQLPAQAQATYRASQAAMVQQPYLLLAGLLLLLAVMFAVIKLPRIAHDDEQAAARDGSSMFAHRHLVLGVVAIFLYVGGEVSIGSFLISFMEDPGIASLGQADAARYVSFYWGGAMVGRFIGSAAMRHVSPGKALALNAACAMLLISGAVTGHGHVAMWSILAVGLCNSIMFPTIFSMALHGLGKLAGQGSGLLCMGIVGGALVPFAQGVLADKLGLQPSFVVPLLCYAFICYYGWKYRSALARPG